MAISSFTPITDHDDRRQHSSLPMTINVSPMEAESLISPIKKFSIDEIGSSPFLKMYAFEIEKLSLQAHAHASASNSCHGGHDKLISASTVGGEDEYVIDLLLTHDKVSTLVETLLAVEAWRLFILKSSNSDDNDDDNVNDDEEDGEQDNNTRKGDKPSKSGSCIYRLAEQGNSLRVAFILHVETTIVSLLTLLFYRKENVLEINNEVLLSIVDYCARQMSSLAAPLSTNDMVRLQKEPFSLDELKKNAIQQQGVSTTVDDIRQNLLQTEYQTAINATALARYLCEHFDSFPISIQSRIINTHDYLMLFIPLIDEPPWTRRRTKNMPTTGEVLVWEKFVNQEWKEIAPSELLQITQCEAQCWIAVFYLTCGNAKCHEQYGLNTYRKEQILRVRKFLNEYMTDQIPVLVDVIRYMEELSLMSVPDYNGNSNTGFGTMLMEQVDQVREGILAQHTNDWDEVFNGQFDTIFSKVRDATDKDLRLISTIYDEAILSSEAAANDVLARLNTKPKSEVNTKPHVLKHASIYIADGSDHRRDESFEEMYHLTLGDEYVIIQTPKGPFKRNKLCINQIGNSIPFPSSSQTSSITIKAEITFEDIVGVTKFVDELNLSQQSNDESKKTQWTQMGKLDGGLVLQMGFKQIDGGHVNFSMVQAFLANPHQE